MRLTQARAHKMGSNDLISELAMRPRAIVKTLTRVSPVYSFSDSLIVVPRRVAEHQIAKGILIPREASRQTFVLSPEWGGEVAA